MSFSMMIARAYLRTRPNRLRTAESARAAVGDRGAPAPVPRGLRGRCDVQTTTVEGREVTTLAPRSDATGVQILYLHGGAFINTLSRPHWSIIDALIKRTGATVTVPLYGLAPEHTAAEGISLARTVYSSLLERSPGAPVHLAGDSAGGTLALSLAIVCRDEGLTPPASLFLFAPWLDISMANPDAQALVALDVMLDIPGLAWCGEQWARSSSVVDPRVNPIMDHLAGLPPLHIYQGDRDIFLADARVFTRKARTAGTQVDLQICSGGFHVYVGATFTPEARKAFGAITSVVRAH